MKQNEQIVKPFNPKEVADLLNELNIYFENDPVEMCQFFIDISIKTFLEADFSKKEVLKALMDSLEEIHFGFSEVV